MNLNDGDTFTFWFVAFLGFCFGLFFVRAIQADDQKLKEACEASLARDQHCVMQYVPEDK